MYIFIYCLIPIPQIRPAGRWVGKNALQKKELDWCIFIHCLIPIPQIRPAGRWVGLGMRVYVCCIPLSRSMKSLTAPSRQYELQSGMLVCKGGGRWTLVAGLYSLTQSFPRRSMFAHACLSGCHAVQKQLVKHLLRQKKKNVQDFIIICYCCQSYN